ncbi:MAG TPA: FAD/NAD(P)-binding protein [Bryobacteraceae bacterium]|jgi:NAD(P)H-flavin reductase
MTAAGLPPVVPPLGADALCPQVTEIVETSRETADTFTLSVRGVEGEALPGFLPGQFSMVSAFGGREVPISISGDPSDRERLTYTIRAVGAATRTITGLRAGGYLAVRGPFGTSWPVEKARGSDVLLMAGGIGLAPLRSVIYTIAQQREEYGRLTVLYGARTPQERLFVKELAVWKKLPDTQILTTVDFGGSSWRGSVGVVTELVRLADLRPERTTVMMCGPEIMMRFSVGKLKQRKFELGRMYLSLERNMRCAVGFCGHCQMGPYFMCKDGPVFCYPQVAPFVEGRHEL